MTQQDAIHYWKTLAEETAETARYNANEHPEWAFFLWHLAIEKALKGLIVKHDAVPPPIHDLEKLAAIAGIAPTPDQQDSLKEISTFAIEARYDDHKRSYYKKVTKAQYTLMWLPICEEVYTWLKNLI